MADACFTPAPFATSADRHILSKMEIGKRLSILRRATFNPLPYWNLSRMIRARLEETVCRAPADRPSAAWNLNPLLSDGTSNPFQEQLLRAADQHWRASQADRLLIAPRRLSSFLNHVARRLLGTMVERWCLARFRQGRADDCGGATEESIPGNPTNVAVSKNPVSEAARTGWQD